MKQQRIPTSSRLAQTLSLAGAPMQMVQRAKEGYYDDFKGPLDTPIMQLVNDCLAIGTPKLKYIANLAIQGEFDSEDWEVEEWAQGPEGQQVLKEFFKK